MFQNPYQQKQLQTQIQESLISERKRERDSLASHLASQLRLKFSSANPYLHESASIELPQICQSANDNMTSIMENVYNQDFLNQKMKREQNYQKSQRSHSYLKQKYSHKND